MRLLFLLLMLAVSVSAQDAKKPATPVISSKKAVAAEAKKLSVETDKKDKKGKAIVREFPVMFDIARKAKTAKLEKSAKDEAKPKTGKKEQ